MSSTQTTSTTTPQPQQQLQHDPELLFRSFLNERDVTGRTALFMAVEVNRPKCVETLLAFRADPNIPNLNEITPLQIACEKGYQTCIRVLVRNHASCQTTKGKNLVELIFESIPNFDERAEVLAYLIANGAQCQISQLDSLISSLPTHNQATFRKAVAEASVLLAKSLSMSNQEKKEINAKLPQPTTTPQPEAINATSSFTSKVE